MTTNALARAVLFLFGVYLVVEYAVALGDSFRLPSASPDVSLGTTVWTTARGFAIQAVGAGVLTLLPGLLLIKLSATWADVLFPRTDSDASTIEFKALLAIGLTVLGYSFVVSGLSGVVGGIVVMVSGPDLGFGFGRFQFSTAAVALLCGLGLCLAGHRAA